ncbi:MAG TPA: response regulator, partial [Longimicrobiales bacterium]|nr:response regulator [Longimicrobiales bacterium]
AIIGFSEILRDGLMGDLTDKQRGFIGDIYNSGTHLLSLINDILDLSKVEAGKMLLDLEPVNIASLLRNSLSIVREKAANRRVHLTLEAADDDLGVIEADARKVKQIVYNLLSNAVKFTGEGGRVTLRARRIARDHVGELEGPWAGRTFPVPESDFTEFLEISILDNGIGISPEGLDYLFQPFNQIDGGLARKFEGTGLGLAMIKLLAELHGGGVAVQSAKDEGSRFTVWLPFRVSGREAAHSPSAPPLSHHETGEKPVALVVEDDLNAAELVRVQLEAEGFTVIHAATAEAALRLATQQPLALITLDIMLPQMDGWEFLSRLKQVAALSGIPVVILSIVADLDKGMALGAAAVMQKPVSRKELYMSLLKLGLLPSSQGDTLKVLIVDDDPTAVELVATSMKDFAGISVLRAYGGQQAIEMARQELPDLILLDLLMPEVSGFDVVDALRERADTADISIIVLTAKHLTTDDRDKLNGFVTTVLEKHDFDRNRFTAEVRRAMSRRQLASV